jgi:hypothetical protein
MRILVVLVLLGIIVSLGSALFSLTREGGTDSKRTVRALTVRIGLSVVLFLFLMFAYWMGWVTPNR